MVKVELKVFFLCFSCVILLGCKHYPSRMESDYLNQNMHESNQIRVVKQYDPLKDPEFIMRNYNNSPYRDELLRNAQAENRKVVDDRIRKAQQAVEKLDNAVALENKLRSVESLLKSGGAQELNGVSVCNQYSDFVHAQRKSLKTPAQSLDVLLLKIKPLFINSRKKDFFIAQKRSIDKLHKLARNSMLSNEQMACAAVWQVLSEMHASQNIADRVLAEAIALQVAREADIFTALNPVDLAEIADNL